MVVSVSMFQKCRLVWELYGDGGSKMQRLKGGQMMLLSLNEQGEVDREQM